jgi:hypothetical protein
MAATQRRAQTVEAKSGWAATLSAGSQFRTPGGDRTARAGRSLNFDLALQDGRRRRADTARCQRDMLGQSPAGRLHRGAPPLSPKSTGKRLSFIVSQPEFGTVLKSTASRAKFSARPITQILSVDEGWTNSILSTVHPPHDS